MFPETVYCPLDEGCGISQTPPPRGSTGGRPERGAHKHNDTTCTHTIGTNYLLHRPERVAACIAGKESSAIAGSH